MGFQKDDKINISITKPAKMRDNMNISISMTKGSDNWRSSDTKSKRGKLLKDMVGNGEN